METRQDTMESKVSDLAAVVARVEQNQTHQLEVSKLRFDALDNGLKAGFSDFSLFSKRVESILSGETQTVQSRMGADLLTDYRDWRKQVEARLPADDEVEDYRDWRKGIDVSVAENTKFRTQGQLVARLLVILVGGNALAIVVAIAALLGAKP